MKVVASVLFCNEEVGCFCFCSLPRFVNLVLSFSLVLFSSLWVGWFCVVSWFCCYCFGGFF